MIRGSQNDGREQKNMATRVVTSPAVQLRLIMVMSQTIISWWSSWEIMGIHEELLFWFEPLEKRKAWRKDKERKIIWSFRMTAISYSRISHRERERENTMITGRGRRAHMSPQEKNVELFFWIFWKVVAHNDPMNGWIESDSDDDDDDDE